MRGLYIRTNEESATASARDSGKRGQGGKKAERVHWTQIGKDAEKPNRQAIEIAGKKWLVDVTGIELVTPCLQTVRQRHYMGCDGELPKKAQITSPSS